jgi:hypothetical protein
MATSSRVRRPIWGRSLYWRIVLGFGACIACVLAVQTMAIVLWLGRVPDNQRLSQFTHSVAADLGGAMAADPGLDVQRYIDLRYQKPVAPLFIGLEHNSQVVLSGPEKPPVGVVDGAREFWKGHPAAIPDSWLTGPFQVAPLMVRGHLAGGVGIYVPQSWQQLLDRRMALLSVVKAIVERHGGAISVTSDPNVATVFTICMPVGMGATLRTAIDGALPGPSAIEGTADVTYANA